MPLARLRGLPGRLRRDRGGAAFLEFALVAPAFLILIFGTIETALVVFLGSTIEASVLEASRFGVTGGTIPGVSREERVRSIIEAKTFGLVDMDELEMDTLVYETFADIGQPEPFIDADGDGRFDSGEDFVDVNGNGIWDADMGEAGLGGPCAIVVYRVSYEWGIITALMQDIIGRSVRHESSVAIRNEPYADAEACNA